MTTETIEEINIDEKIKKEIVEPGKWNVIFMNDDTTPMDFVIELLIIVFKHSRESAEKVMLQVHEKGSAVVGTYMFEIAEQKTTEATQCARQQGFPLGIMMEKE
jgi:ATP-dependent Clp protease adaptor protein ClpS